MTILLDDDKYGRRRMRSNLKTIHIAKEPEYWKKKKGGGGRRWTQMEKKPEGAEIKLRYYDYVALNPLFKYLYNT